MEGLQSLLLLLVLLYYFVHALGFLMLWAELTHLCGGKKHFFWSIQQFSPPSYPLLSTAYQCDRYMSSHVHGGSSLACQVLPDIGADSILELEAPGCVTDPAST